VKIIKFSQEIYRKLQIIQSKDAKLFKKIHKQLKLFKEDPKHKSLRLHKVTREVKNTWSISIDKSFRMLYTENGFIYFFKMGTHDEVYRKR
jgi:Txe/YoeB family toxin of Txe-Axe toxin-antitoxin module